MSIFLALAEILFIGDGRLERGVPLLVEAGLEAMGGSVSVAADFIDGGALQYNFDTPSPTYPDQRPPRVEAMSELGKGETRAVILSEAGPLDKILQWHMPAESLVAYAAIARASNPDVRIFYAETWQSLTSGSTAATQDDPAADIPWRERIATEGDIWRAIAAKAGDDPLGAPVTMIPIGRAMGRLADEIAAGRVPGIAGIEELFEDDIHPNGRGMYFVAMVELASLLGRTPEGLPAKLLRTWPSRDWIISDEQAAIFQRIAWEEVQAFEALPPLFADDLIAATTPAPTPVVATPIAEPEVAEIPPAPVPDVIDIAPITNDALFMGLAGVVDWSSEVPFLDLMKSARPWTGHITGQWGGWDHTDLKEAGALDENGWPKRIPEGLSGLVTFVLTDMPEDGLGLRGRYLLRYDGSAKIAVEGRGSPVVVEPGKIAFDYEPGEGAVILTISEIDESDPVRNITIVREDRIDAFGRGEVFNPDWLARIRGVKGVRFMDWMQTNNSTESRFIDRPKPSDYTWALRGVPVEVMIALCNSLDADGWFTLPHLANNDYVRQFAQMVHQGLDTDRRAWVEYSNEMWNWSFGQAHWAEDQGKARWGEQYSWVQYYALRSTEVAAIWTDVYGADADDRLVRVISSQTGYFGLEPYILEAPLVMGEGKAAPATSFDAYAITGYFSGDLGFETKADTVRGWVDDSVAAAEQAAADQGLVGDEAAVFVADHRFDQALPKAAQELRDGSVTGNSGSSLKWNTDEAFPYHADIARKHGLALVMYEGGTHVVGIGEKVNDELLAAFFAELNYSDEMASIYGDLLKAWADVSDAPFNHYVDVAKSSKWGSWGAMRHLGDDSARWRALASGCDGC